MDFKLVIEEKDNFDLNIKGIVKVINSDLSLKIVIVEDIYMVVKEVTIGFIIIYLCLLIDNVVYRFLGKDGSII